MEMALPVCWDSSLGTWYRLTHRMALGTRERWSVTELAGGEVPEPVLTWLEAAHHGVPRLRRVA
jgi:hypothetical protein